MAELPVPDQEASKEFDVSGFSGVELATIGDLRITKGPVESLQVEGDARTLESLDVDVRESMLTIRTRPHVQLHPRAWARFTLTARKLDTVVLSGSGNVHAGTVEGERVAITVSGSGGVTAYSLFAKSSILISLSGSGNVRAGDSMCDEAKAVVTGSGDVEINRLDSNRLSATISGSGSVRFVDREVERQVVTISGSGNYWGDDVTGTEAEVVITGSGSAHMGELERLKVTISGSGDVFYWDHPELAVARTGSGRVISD